MDPFRRFHPLSPSVLTLALAALLLAPVGLVLDDEDPLTDDDRLAPAALGLDVADADEEDLSDAGQPIPARVAAGCAGPTLLQAALLRSTAVPNWDRPPPCPVLG